MLMSLSIHLHGLHLDAQYSQTWHLLTQLRSGERTGHRLLWSTTLLLPTLLSDSHVSISLVIHGLWWTVSGQVKAHVVLTCTNVVSPNHLLVTVASDRPWTTLSTRAHQANLKVDWIYPKKQMMTQWWLNLQRLQHSRNNSNSFCA